MWSGSTGHPGARGLIFESLVMESQVAGTCPGPRGRPQGLLVGRGAVSGPSMCGTQLGGQVDEEGLWVKGLEHWVGGSHQGV